MASNSHNPAMSPPEGHPGMSHCDHSGKRKRRKKGVVGGKQKNKKSTTAEKQWLKEKAKPPQRSSQRGSK